MSLNTATNNQLLQQLARNIVAQELRYARSERVQIDPASCVATAADLLHDDMQSVLFTHVRIYAETALMASLGVNPRL